MEHVYGLWSPCYSWSRTIPCDTELKVRNQSELFSHHCMKNHLRKKYRHFQICFIWYPHDWKTTKDDCFYFFLKNDDYVWIWIILWGNIIALINFLNIFHFLSIFYFHFIIVIGLGLHSAMPRVYPSSVLLASLRAP